MWVRSASEVGVLWVLNEALSIYHFKLFTLFRPKQFEKKINQQLSSCTVVISPKMIFSCCRHLTLASAAAKSPFSQQPTTTTSHITCNPPLRCLPAYTQMQNTHMKIKIRLPRRYICPYPWLCLVQSITGEGGREATFSQCTMRSKASSSPTATLCNSLSNQGKSMHGRH